MMVYPLAFIHVKQTGKIAYGPKYLVTDKFGKELYEESKYGDGITDLYNFVYEAFPDNEWDDIVWDGVDYYDDHIDIYVSTGTFGIGPYKNCGIPSMYP